MDAVVINNQLSKDYPTKSLCGAAVVWKFCCYLDTIMKTNYAIEYEDLAALGLIGDMMNMKDFETHQIIKDGLQRIRNPFFVEMMNRQKFQFEGGVTPIGIAFYVVPYINAMTRSGTMEEKYLMFEAMLEWRSDEMIPSTKRGCKG
jgi:single-stranded-DNA-specific exonuclease